MHGAEVKNLRKSNCVVMQMNMRVLDTGIKHGHIPTSIHSYLSADIRVLSVFLGNRNIVQETEILY